MKRSLSRSSKNILAKKGCDEMVTFKIQQKYPSKIGISRIGHPQNLAENILAKCTDYDMVTLQNLADNILAISLPMKRSHFKSSRNNLAKLACYDMVTLQIQQIIFQQFSLPMKRSHFKSSRNNLAKLACYDMVTLQIQQIISSNLVFL